MQTNKKGRERERERELKKITKNGFTEKQKHKKGGENENQKN